MSTKLMIKSIILEHIVGANALQWFPNIKLSQTMNLKRHRVSVTGILTASRHLCAAAHFIAQHSKTKTP